MPGIDECLGEAMRLPGARSAAVIDWISGLALGAAGNAPAGDHETAACEAAEVARLVAEHPTFAPAGNGHESPAVEDVIVVNADSYHLLRFVGAVFDSSVFLHLCVGREEGNLAFARLRLEDIATRMVL